MKTSETVSSLYPALIKMWQKFPNMYPGAEGYGYKYIELAKVVTEAKRVLPSLGLAAIQFPTSDDAKNIGVTTRVIHESGEWIEATVYAEPTNMKGVNQTQATGSTITYLRRYGLLCVLGAAGDKDLDGRTENEPMVDPTATVEDEAYIQGADSMSALAQIWSEVQPRHHGNDRTYLSAVKDAMKAKLS